MNKNTLMEFPCSFPVKIIGIQSPTFKDEIKCIIKKHFLYFEEEHFVAKNSKNNNYIAITATVLATNQNMLDDFYQEVTKHPNIKMVL